MYGPVDGHASHPGEHALFQVPGFSRFCIPPDLMHSTDLGITQMVLGSALFELVTEGPLDGSSGQRLAQLWARIQEI